MTTDLPDGTVLTVDGDLRTVGGLVATFFTARGWSVHERGPGLLEVETGSRRRTVLLGSFAGSRFHLTAPIELRELPSTVEVHYRWGAGAGRALGGAVGRARAARRHREASAALAEHLGADGRAVQSRPLAP
ncbi:MAG: hypothetical protein ACTHV2_07040 [Brachybacterium sp.]|uniref:hypothetical protein n=1 Tax=Brachybacterium sp. TaxID=1891286 RepID=UPI003F924252